MLILVADRSSVDGDHGPKLWCGMANGKLQVFDASTWMLEQPCLQAKDRIVSPKMCLFATIVLKIEEGEAHPRYN